MAERFTDRVAVVTGASSGIGHAIAERLAADGASVVACARHEPEQEMGAGITFVTADISDEPSATALLDTAVDRYGRVDLVVADAGIEGLAKHLAGRGGEHGVRVNVVRPGRILTDKWEGVLGRDGLFWSHYEKIQLFKRHGRTQDAAAAVAFLASDEAAFITAAVLDVDGGAVVKL